MTRRRGLVSTTLLLLPLQIIFRGWEAVLPVLLTHWFGSTAATDVYTFAWSVFYFAGSLIFSAYHDSAVVPILTEVKVRDPGSLAKVAGSLLAHTWVFGSALAALVSIGAFGWFAYLYDGADFRLAALMVPAFGIQLVAMSTKTFFAAVLSAHHKFVPYPIASTCVVVVTVVFVAFTRQSLDVVSVPIGAMLGEIVAAIMLGAVVVRYLGIRPALSLDRPEPVRRFARLASSEVGGGAVTRINPAVDQLMAGFVGVAGGATLLRLSNDVASLPTSLLQATFLSVLLAHLADDFTRRDLAKVRETVSRAVVVVFLILTASAVLLYLVREPLLRLVFLHGRMKVESVERLAHILPYHLVGLGSFGVLLVLARANVAIQNSRIMISMGILNATTNLVLNVVLSRFLGIEGLALATSLVHTVVAIVFWFRFRRRVRELAQPAPAASVEPA